MLIIGHRGAAGLAPENTIESIQAAYEAGADMIEFDVRLTRDNRLVAIHDARLVRTHGHKDAVARLTYRQLRALTKDKPVPLVAEVLDDYFGRVLLNIELKSRGSAERLIRLLKKKYITKTADWDNFIISSFKATELMRVRRLARHANLALLHDQNPFIFIAYHRFIKLTAVGFHRLHLNAFATEIAKRAGLFTYTYTVNRPGAIHHLAKEGIDGVVTNYPDKFIAALKKAG